MEKDNKGFRTVEAETPGEVMAPVGFGALGAVVKAEIDMQIATAKAYPRSLTRFQKEVTQMATFNEKIAEECFYALPRKERDPETGQQVKKTITGPSARYGEIVLSAWGNCRAGARPIGEEADFVICQGFFFDVERNVAVQREVKRRITTRSGARYSPDMIATTTNAGCSIAQRNAVFAGIPKVFWTDGFEAARKAAIGDVKTLATKRSEMIAYFGKMGVTPDLVITAVDVVGIEDIGIDELVELKGIATALKEGDTTVEQAFPKVSKVEPEKKGTEGVKEKIRDAKGAQEKTAGDLAAGGAGAESGKKPEPAPKTVEKEGSPAVAGAPQGDPGTEKGVTEGETTPGAPPPAQGGAKVSPMEQKAMLAMTDAIGNRQLDKAWTTNVPADLKTKDPEAYKRLADHYNARLQTFKAK